MTGDEVLGTERPAGSLIFIVEDDNDISALIEHTLKAAGFVTRVFADGSHVVEAVKKQLPAYPGLR